MQFELSSALIDEIKFRMEDQHGDFLLDTHKGKTVKANKPDLNDAAAVERYIALPKWGPENGFRLMERFTAGLRAVPVRDELTAVLDRGRGVFRAFKDALGRYPETKKLWHAYKENEMRREITAWYNVLRELWGLELIGEEPEDITGLTLEDFRFRKGTSADVVQVEELHKVCLDEYFDTPGEGGGAYGILADMGEWVFPADVSFIAETGGGDFAGYASAVVSGDTDLRICAVEVRGEYRGLGLGKSLVSHVLEYADARKINRVIVDLPAGQEYFSRVLSRESFRNCVQRYVRNRRE